MGVLDHYVLTEDHQVVLVTDFELWAKWYENADRHVKQTYTETAYVSTVFLGLDHGWGKGPPIVFETMVFNRGKDDMDWKSDDCWRYSSWDDALSGHNTAVRRVLRAEALAHASGGAHHGDDA